MSHYFTDNRQLAQNRKDLSFRFSCFNLTFISDNGVFCKDKIDEGTKVLLNVLHENELGDKISGEEKSKVETEIEATKKALETNDTEKIKEATEKLTKVFYEMSEQLYKNANPNAGADTGEQPNAGNDGNVYDADYKVEDDK